MSAIDMKPKPKRKTRNDLLMDRVNQVYDTGKTLGILMGLVDGIQKFIKSHQTEHRTARVVSWIQTALVIGMFCYLKWGV